MALIDSEGFGLSTAIADVINYSLFNDVGGNLATANAQIGTGGPLGDNFFQCDTATGILGHSQVAITRILPSTFSSFFWGARVAIPNNSNQGGGPVIAFMDASGVTEQFRLQFNQAGVITAFRGGSSLGTSAAGAIPIAGASLNWCYLEVGVVLSATVGTITVKVNGTTVMALTGLNNCGGTGTVCGAWKAGSGANTDNITSINFMHYYFADATGGSPWNTFIGDVRVQTLLPTADNSVQFSHNGLGSNHANAALVPPVPNTDFNSDSTSGHQDSFNMGTIAASLTTVFGVNVKVLAEKSDAGARNLQTVVISGGTTSTGTSTGLQQTAQQLKTMYQTDPNTSAQWTAANVNLAKAGYKIP